ncbi:DNA-protecting protein DprA [Rhodobacterales bacterium HKCCE2091]|nr:DNA-protecting protein DprA [Rhodobacterales bacterium HKCCE2091]
MDADLATGFSEAPLGYAPPPSTAGQDRLDRLRLIRSRRVGPATFRRLMAEHGTAGAALAALPDVARAAGTEDYAPCPEGVARAEMKTAKAAGAQMLCLGDPDYPALLAETESAPPVLWAIGDVALLSRPTVSLVGTRNASSLGARMASRLAADLGKEGFVVVSGLARGIDGLAHKAALATGTISVEAGGLDLPYPTENAGLAADIARSGLRISEQPFGLAPQARHFPLRNRIVAGLSRGLVVIEAAARSGSLITARAALDLGREVMAVPGHPMDARASGCNMLIRDGAVLVRNADDVIEALGPPAEIAQADLPLDPPDAVPPAAVAGDLTDLILDRLGPSPTPEDQLIRDLAAPASRVAEALAALELSGAVERRPGGMLARAV